MVEFHVTRHIVFAFHKFHRLNFENRMLEKIVGMGGLVINSRKEVNMNMGHTMA